MCNLKRTGHAIKAEVCPIDFHFFFEFFLVRAAAAVVPRIKYDGSFCYSWAPTEPRST